MRALAFPLASAALLLGFTPLAAQEPDAHDRASTLVVYGDDPCPQSTDEEIVVCARRPESERYRIPEEFRENKEKRGSVAWGARVEEMEEATRFTRPNSCSVVGSWGQTGCLADAIRQWSQQRRAARSARRP
ncbi:DUF4139 domain-containing protein [Sphingomonas parva]|uniref:DUF4139 domain-containing protein n=1 Tax=Sphingomonas parva TaxID=2555898 RepID=UPI001CDCD5C2|nr:DUF4139 domain-containing protein [Sphingomonas parva]